MKTTLLASLAFLASTARADDPKALEGAYGQLEFKSRRAEFGGTDVGRGDDLRKYIAGDPDSPQRAVWHFGEVSRGQTAPPNDAVPAKFRCSQFYLIRAGAPNAQVVIRAVSHTCPQQPPDLQEKGEWQWAGKNAKALREQYEADVAAYRAKKIDPAKADVEGWKAANALAERYGYYEVRLPKVFDLVEADIDLPAGLFRNAVKREPAADGKPAGPMVSVYMKCETPGLLLGAMGADFHLAASAVPKK